MENYNYGQYIAEALNAIVTQSYVPKEIIIVDDASTDNSVSVIDSYLKRYSYIKLIRNEKNMGVTYSANRALGSATGDYVYASTSDDKVLPGFFERSMKMLSQYPQAGLCFSEMLTFDEEKRTTSEHKFYLRKASSYLSPNDLIDLLSRELYTPIYGPTVIYKRSALIEAGGFIPQLKWSCDAFVHHVIGFRYGVCYIPEILTMQRIHAKQYSAGIKNIELERQVIRNILDELLSPKYHDVLPQFKRTAPISCYPWVVLNEALRSKKYRGFVSSKLIRYALYDKFIRQPLRALLPASWTRKAINSLKRLKLLLRSTDAANRD
jgi:glycosyltransferase involved in cell wall biosynthesis